jgi:transposase
MSGLRRRFVGSTPSSTCRNISIAFAPSLAPDGGRLKDWRHIHTRYDRCAHAFFSAICIAATVIFWLGQ